MTDLERAKAVAIRIISLRVLDNEELLRQVTNVMDAACPAEIARIISSKKKEADNNPATCVGEN